ncbi:MAG: class I SAM-dependent DNA methyltransferase, partial [Candidatus Gracilibacteria bacterium]
MTLQDLKPKIWSACDVLRSQGFHITDYMEQITYLMFLKNLDEKEENDKELDKALGREHKPLFDDEKFYWKNWTQKSGRPLVKFVKNDLFSKLTDINGRNPIVKKIFKDAVFTIEEPQAFKKVIGIIDSIQFYKQPIDVKGATYEFLLSKLAEAGAAGEFFTPRHIIRAMVEIVDPKIGETICDPAMGTGGFLIGALNHILESNGDGYGDGRNLTNEQFAFLHDETFFGYEQNRRTYRMALMNMYLHGANNPKLERINTLGDGTHTERKYDVIFANPPYGGKIDNVRGNFTIATNKTELLFLQHIVQTLKEGGRAGVILPEGVMFQSGAAQKIREILLNQCETFTVVSMPAGIFQPYTGVKTDLLFFKKGL